MKVDIVMQGPIYPFTPEILEHYLTIPVVNKVILSCWTTDTTLFAEEDKTDRVIIEKSEMSKLPICGGGNVNFQLTTSLAGVRKSQADIVIKVRTDMQVHSDDITKLVNFLIEKGSSPQIKKLDGTLPKGKIIVGSVFTQFPYHPRDHIYVGYKEDLECLFNIPLSGQKFLIPDTNTCIRAEAYIGSYYFSKFNEEAAMHVKQPHQFLTDSAPRKMEAFKISKEFMDELFLSSPKIRHIWKKHGIFSYSTLWSPAFEEYWSESW